MRNSQFVLHFDSSEDKETASIRCMGINELGELMRFETGAPNDGWFNRIGAELALQAGKAMPGAQAVRVESCVLTDKQIPVLLCYPEYAKKLPVVIFNHGSGSNAVQQLFMGIPLAQEGFFTILPDARFHGRRQLKQFNEVFFDRRNYKRLYLELLLGTSDDISAIIDELKDDPRADSERIGISGISQGGFVSFMTITRDKRIKAAAPMIGSPDLEDTFGSSPPFEELDDELRQRISTWSPLRNCSLMPPVALLVQNGNSDRIVPIEGVRKLDRELKVLYHDMPERYQYIEYDGVGHSISVEDSDNPDIMKKLTIDWLKRFL